MSEERDEYQESATFNGVDGLGEIDNEEARDPFSRGWPQPAPNQATGATDLIEKQKAQSLPQAGRAETIKALSIAAEVRAIFDSRPVNGFDGFLAGIVVVESNIVVCDLLLAPPAPASDPLGDVSPSVFYSALDQTFNCTAYSVSATLTGAANGGVTFTTANADTTLVNAYLWIDGVLIDSQAGVAANAVSLGNGGANIDGGSVVVAAITTVTSEVSVTCDLEFDLIAF